MTDNDKSFEELKARAKEKAAEKITKTRKTITFKSGSDSGIVFKVLEAADGPLDLKELKRLCSSENVKNLSRVKTVANWFANNDIATKNNGTYELVPITDGDPADPVEIEEGGDVDGED